MIINDTINLHNVGQTKSYKGGLMLLRYPFDGYLNSIRPPLYDLV